MTEPIMSKLEIIKELHRIADRLAPSNKYDDIGRVQDILFNLFDAGDIEWLIEQAEQVEVLEANLKGTTEVLDETIVGLQRMAKDNDRLRGVLTQISVAKDYDMMNEVDFIEYYERVARQALIK